MFAEMAEGDQGRGSAGEGTGRGPGGVNAALEISTPVAYPPQGGALDWGTAAAGARDPHFSNEASTQRLMGARRVEWPEKWTPGQRYFAMEGYLGASCF